MKRSATLATVFLTVVALFSVPALSLEPITAVFGTTPEARVRTFQIRNTQSQPISVRVRLMTRDLTTTGEEIRGAADDEWIVFPRLITLQPGASQAVRVQYTGPAGIEVERAYRIIAEQLPVDFSEGAAATSGIALLFRYEGSVYVRPRDARPEIVLADVARAVGSDGAPILRVRFENRGRAHGILEDLRLTVQHATDAGVIDDSFSVGVEDLPRLGGANLLAGRAIEETVPLPPSWQGGTIDVQYDADIIR